MNIAARPAHNHTGFHSLIPGDLQWSFTVEFLSIFALFVLIILAAAAVALWVWLAIWPGRIAKERGHRQAEAVRVMGYWGAITLGILMPIAFVWAYWDYGDDKIRARGEATR
jgi:uncharacterized BrkB/YihY/UPF0761 family membrane protein